MRARLAPEPSLEDSPWKGLGPEMFEDWGWQLRNRLQTKEDVQSLFALTPEEQAAFSDTSSVFRFGVSPYYALLTDRGDPNCPIRRQWLPSSQEAVLHDGELADPLGEETREAAPNVIHRYPDRVLLLSTDRCPVYCRFCTRRRIVGRTERQAPRALLAEAFQYIREHSEIREVIVSGGDALMLSDRQIAYILHELRRAPHVDIIRIATRMPVTCPMRITSKLASTIAEYGPVYVLTHFNHPRECTPSAARAVAALVESGIPVWNQSVLLRGINDDLSVIADLNRKLVWMRAVPYYLHQCDLALGIEHFRTPIQTGIEIIEGLRGHVSGLMVPKLCVDVPGGLGKVTVQPDWVVSREGRRTLFRTYRGEEGAYIDPQPIDSEAGTF